MGKSANSWLRAITTAAVAFALALLPTAAHANPGDLDPAFGTAGIVSGIHYSDGSTTDEYTSVQAVTVQADGKIVVAGNTDGTNRRYSAFIARYNANGSLDTSFATQGWALFDFGAGTFETVTFTDVSVLTDGRIFASGYSCVPGDCLLHRVSLARVLSNGQPDTSFSSDGTKILPFNGYVTADATANQVLADGTTYLVGVCYPTSNSQSSIFAAKLLPSGALDSTFGTSGQACVNPTNPSLLDAVYYTGIAVLPDGSSLLSGEITLFNGSLVTRLTPAGAIDTSYGNPSVFPGSTLYFPATNLALSTAATFANNKFTVAGYGTSGQGNFGTLAQFDTALTLQQPFGNASSGIVEVRQQSTGTKLLDVTAACNGDLYTVGNYVASQSSDQGILAAFASTGTPLTGFASTGQTTLSVPGAVTNISVALDGGTKAVVAGFATLSAQDNPRESFIAVFETPNQGCPNHPTPADPTLAATGSTAGSTALLGLAALAALGVGLSLWRLRVSSGLRLARF